MIIRRIKLVDVFSHEHSELELPDGIISIVGPNGAGKSSIVEAVYLALFSDPRPDVRGGKKEFIVRRGRSRAEIGVEFEVGGRRYLVVRTFSVAEAGDAYLYELAADSRRLLAKGVQNVPREVGRILGLALGDLKDLVRSTVLALQGELTQIIDVADSERKEQILSLLGLDHLERALERLRGYAKGKKELEGERREKENRIRDRERQAERARARVRELEARLRERERSLLEAEERVRKLEEDLRAVGAAIELCRRLRAALVSRRIGELEERVRLLEPLEGWSPEKFSATLDELRRKESKLASTERSLAKILSELSSELGREIGSAEDLVRAREELRGRLDDLNRRIGRYRGLSDLYSRMLSTLEIGDRCPVCGSRVGDPGKLRERLEAEREDVARMLGELEERKARLERTLSLIEGRLREVIGLSKELKSIEEEVRSLRGELDRLVAQALSLCERVGLAPAGAEECLNALGSMKAELAEARAELRALRGMLPEGRTPGEPAEVVLPRLLEALERLGLSAPRNVDLGTLEGIDERLGHARRTLEDELKRAQGELARLREEVGELRATAEVERKTLRECEDEISKLREEVEELDRKIKAIEALERLGELYLGKDGLVARALTRVVRRELERRANRILSRLGLPSIRVGDGFEITIRLPAGELPVRNASGGERVGISIALRLALGEIVMGRSPTTLILDEPTVYLDESRRAQVFDVIRDLGRSLRQVIVVTHDESVINVSDRVVFVENMGGVSRVSKGPARAVVSPGVEG